jgi:hypothetical protein
MASDRTSLDSLSTTCSSCNKFLERPLHCGRCNVTTYCDEDCQRAHWKLHKKTCTPAAATSSAASSLKSSLDVVCEACCNFFKDKNSMRCGGCQTISYCNADCQRAHWKVHKKTCKSRAAAVAAKDLTAALAGDTEAQFNLGLSYEYGRGVVKDMKEAARWYRKAADAGQLDAQCNLADCYSLGTGVKIDLIVAFHWYRTSRRSRPQHLTVQPRCVLPRRYWCLEGSSRSCALVSRCSRGWPR